MEGGEAVIWLSKAIKFCESMFEGSI